MATLSALVAALPEILRSDKDRIKNDVLPTLKADLAATESLETGELFLDIGILKEEHPLTITPSSIQHFAARAGAPEEEGRGKRWFRQTREWLTEPRNYLRLLGGVLGLLFLGLLLAEWVLHIPVFSAIIYPLWIPYMTFWQFIIFGGRIF